MSPATNAHQGRLWLKRIPEALKSLRLKALLSEVEVAAEARRLFGLSTTGGQIRFWENGQGFPSMLSLIAFLVATKSSPLDLAEEIVSTGHSLSLLDRRISTLEAQMSLILSADTETLDQEDQA